MEGNWGGNIDDIKNVPDSYIQRLRDDNVEWVGIKLSIFNETIADPVVKVRYRPANDRDYSKMYSFDDVDVVNAVTKLRQQGFKVYLSLILMQPQAGDTSTSPSSGGCNTSQYAVDSHLMGDPEVPVYWNSWVFGSACINPAYWWWSPSHPSHAANVATFWATYTQVAVKYARLAQQLGVGMFAVGEETDRLFRTRTSTRFPNHFRNELSQMVGAVRSEYTGLLTYGINAAVYTEHPEWWGYDTAASSSLFQQANMFQALFNVNRAFNYLVRGTTFFGFVIDTNPFIAAANNNTRNMELHGRPSEQVLRNAYGALRLQ